MCPGCQEAIPQPSSVTVFPFQCSLCCQTQAELPSSLALPDPPPVAPNLSPSGRVAASAAPGAWRGVGTQSLETSLPPYPNPFGSQLGEQIGVLRDPTLSDLFGSGISGSKKFI